MDGVEPRQLLCAFTIPKLKTTVLLPALEGLATKNIIQNATSYIIKSVLSQSSKDSPSVKNENINFILKQQKSFLSCFSENFELSASDFKQVRRKENAFITFKTDGSFIPYYNFEIKKKENNLRKTFPKDDSVRKSLVSPRNLVPVAGKEDEQSEESEESSDSSDDQGTSKKSYRCPFKFTSPGEANTRVCFVAKITYPIVLVFFAHMFYNTFVLESDMFNNLPFLDYNYDKIVNGLMDLDDLCFKTEIGLEFLPFLSKEENSNTLLNTTQKLLQLRTFIKKGKFSKCIQDQTIFNQLYDQTKRSKILGIIDELLKKEEEVTSSYSDFLFDLFIPNYETFESQKFVILTKTLGAIGISSSSLGQWGEFLKNKLEEFSNLALSMTDATVIFKAQQAGLLVYCHFISNFYTLSYMGYSLYKIVRNYADPSDADISEFVINGYLWYFTRNVLPFLSLKKGKNFASSSFTKMCEYSGNKVADAMQKFVKFTFGLDMSFPFLRSSANFDFLYFEYVDLMDHEGAFEQYLSQIFFITGVWYVKDVSAAVLGKIFFKDKKSFFEIFKALFLPRFPIYLIVFLQGELNMYPKIIQNSSGWIFYVALYQYSGFYLVSKSVTPDFIRTKLTASFRTLIKNPNSDEESEDSEDSEDSWSHFDKTIQGAKEFIKDLKNEDSEDSEDSEE